MDITILGSGGNTSPPMPTCDCHVCIEAREKGVPYSRSGNAIFIHDENILIDAPERAWDSLNREGIDQIDHVLLSHFHADHVLGLRVLQPLGLEEPPIEDFVGEQTDLIMSQQTRDRVIGKNEVFEAVTDTWADVRILNDGERMDIGNLEIEMVGAPIEQGGEPEIFGFLIRQDETTVFISPDENLRFDLEGLPDLDCWIKETGYFLESPDGTPLQTAEAERTVLEDELSFQQSLEQIREVEPDRVILTEIEELFRRSYDDYKELEDEYSDLDLTFAYDGMHISL